MNKTVTIFGSSKPLPGEKDYEDAYRMAKILGESGLNICSGGFQGIMDAVSKGASESGTEAIGITVNLYNSLPSRHLSAEIKCESLFKRLETLIEKGDAYIVLPGGTGTLLEFSLVWEYINKGLIHKKPFASLGSMWKRMTEIVDERMVLEKREKGIVKNFNSVEECAEYIVTSLE